MNTKILICGLPDSGKTTLAKQLQEIFKCSWFNADDVRKKYNDWDFSEEGRIRQAHRMKELCSGEGLFIADFVAPTEEIRKIFNSDFTIWMNTIKESKYKDTNKIFEEPKADLVIKDFNYTIENAIKSIIELSDQHSMKYLNKIIKENKY